MPDKPPVDLAHGAAKKSICRLLEPLVGSLLDAGFSARDLTEMVRAAAAKSIADKQLEASGRLNISGIASITGLPRAEISRLLKSPEKRGYSETPKIAQKSTNRIMAAWYGDVRFSDRSGNPAILKLYGKGITFETLIKRFGGGMPSRAVLDELIRVDAIELLPDQAIRVKSQFDQRRVAMLRTLEQFGQHSTEMLSILFANLDGRQAPQFMTNASDMLVPDGLLVGFRRALAASAEKLILKLQRGLAKDRLTSASTEDLRNNTRVSLTMFCYEDRVRKNKVQSLGKRKNFKRRG